MSNESCVITFSRRGALEVRVDCGCSAEEDGERVGVGVADGAPQPVSRLIAMSRHKRKKVVRFIDYLRSEMNIGVLFFLMKDKTQKQSLFCLHGGVFGKHHIADAARCAEKEGFVI